MDISQTGGGNSYDEVVAALDSHGWTTHHNGPNHVRAQCPAHEGDGQNLAVDRTTEDKALIYCHSHQCDYADVMLALGLEAGKGSGSVGYAKMALREHSYFDADHKVVATKTKFLVAAGDEGFRYEWQTDYPAGKLSRDERPMYAAHDWDLALDTLYIVEGEKDADKAMSEWGVNATSPMFGAGSWEDHWTNIVKDQFTNFRIIADRDDAGVEGAEKILQALGGLSVEVYLPPEFTIKDRKGQPKAGKDVADMISAGLGLDDLELVSVEMAEEKPHTEMAVFEEWGDFWKQNYEKASWLIEPIVLTGRATNLHAEAGQGKSELVLAMVAASGVQTMFLDREMTKGDTKERFEEMGYGPSDLRHLHYAFFPDYPPLDEPEGGEAILLDALAKNVRLVVIDSLSKFVAGDENENGTNQRLYTYTVNRLRKEGIAFLMIDHMGKNHSLGARGASAKKDNVDLHIAMKRNSVGQSLVVKKKRNSMVKDRYDVSRTLNPLTYHVIDGEIVTSSVKILVNKMDEWNIGADLGRDDAAMILRGKGEKVSNADVVKAQQLRRGERTAVDKATENLGDLVGEA